MMAVLTVAPVAAHETGVLLAVTVALTVTTFVALGMVIAQHRRTSRLFLSKRSLSRQSLSKQSFALGGLGAASVAVLGLTIGLGSALVDAGPPSAAAVVPLVVTAYALENYQLATLTPK